PGRRMSRRSSRSSTARTACRSRSSPTRPDSPTSTPTRSDRAPLGRPALRARYIARRRSAPAQLVEAGVADAEEVAQLVQHGHGDLLDQVLAGAGMALQRTAEDEDPIRLGAPLEDAALVQRDPFVQTQQLRAPGLLRCGLLLHEDRDVRLGDGACYLLGQRVQGVVDRLLEVLAADPDHDAIEPWAAGLRL